MVESICTRSCECRTIPSILITGSHIVCGVILLGDCEVQGISARAIIVVCIIIGVGTTLVVVYIMPDVLLASILMEGVMCAVMDCEVQGVSAEASIIVCIVVSICTALCVVDIVPWILFASILMIGVVSAVIDCEVEGVSVGAR